MAAPRLLAYLQLMRAPNVFTAMADILMGYFVVHARLGAPAGLLLLIGSSAALYLAGMVLNDVYDLEVDSRERPSRPLPSGRIAWSTARRLGVSLLVGGVVLGWLAGILFASSTAPWRSGVVASALALCVWLYDAYLKKTLFGPLGMGSCRLLNVLLGMSFAPLAGEQSLLLGYSPFQGAVAAGIGIYIVGVTVFARGEAERSHRATLLLGALIMAAGLGLLAFAPRWATLPYRLETTLVWPATLVFLTIPLWRRALIAVIAPDARQVQAAVKQGILSLIVLDAAVCLLVGPTYAAIIVVLLLIPSMALGRWVYST